MIRRTSRIIFRFCSSHTIEPAFEPYLTLRKQDFEKLSQQSQSNPIIGMSTP